MATFARIGKDDRISIDDFTGGNVSVYFTQAKVKKTDNMLIIYGLTDEIASNDCKVKIDDNWKDLSAEVKKEEPRKVALKLHLKQWKNYKKEDIEPLDVELIHGKIDYPPMFSGWIHVNSPSKGTIDAANAYFSGESMPNGKKVDDSAWGFIRTNFCEDIEPLESVGDIGEEPKEYSGGGFRGGSKPFTQQELWEQRKAVLTELIPDLEGAKTLLEFQVVFEKMESQVKGCTDLLWMLIDFR